MGLDLVEFVIALEEAFGISIPDVEAEKLVTPGHVVRYLEARLGGGDGGGCLGQRAFNALRRAGMEVLHLPRSAFRPDTRWESVLPPRDRRHTWDLLHGATGTPAWPHMWPWGYPSPQSATMADTARYLATHAAGALHERDVAWSTSQIKAIVAELMDDQFGIKNFGWDDGFVNDLGLD